MPKKVKKSARKKAVRKLKKPAKKPARKAAKRAAKPKAAKKAAVKAKTKAKARAKKSKPRVVAAGKPIGEVTHYYDKIGVAVIKLSAPLAVGEAIKISGHGKEFAQSVDSMQIEHQAVQKADKGQELGLKLKKEVKEGDKIFRA